MSKDLSSILEDFLPDLNSDFVFNNLGSKVDIFRDKWGIPHIKTKDEFDLFFAQGFATAQDRLWHMDFDRHRALGKSSELLGYKTFEDDKLLMKMNVEKASRADYECSSTSSKKMLDSYTNGVNAFIESTTKFPVEYFLLKTKPGLWEPWHSISVYKVRNMLMGTYEMKLLKTQVYQKIGKELFEKIWGQITDEDLLTVPPNQRMERTVFRDLDSLSESVNLLNYLKETDVGSNAWVISGDRTKSGLPIVAGDSHRALDTPSVYYQIHLICDQFSVSGYSIPGFPGAPHFSHTSHVAFGMTHGNADYQDLFLEKFRNRGTNLEYLYKDQWYEADIDLKAINVKNGRRELIEVITTRHGSVIGGNPRAGYGLIFSHTGTNSGTKWVDTVYQILYAKNASELVESLKEWTEPVNNFVYADTTGQIGYKLRGKIPIRDQSNHMGLVSGWDGKHDWESLVPFEELPFSVNPSTGFIVTCNQRVVSPDYPYYIGDDFRPEYRASRIISRILELPKGQATVDDMANIHSDRLSIPANILFKKIREMNLFSEYSEDLVKLIENWDFEMQLDSPIATLYSRIKKSLIEGSIKLVFNDSVYQFDSPKFSRAYMFIIDSIYYKLINQILGKEKFIDVQELFSLLIFSVESNMETFQDNNLVNQEWGKVHQTNPKHPLSEIFPEYASLLNPPRIPIGGDSDTPQQGGYIGNIEVNSVSVNRYIHDTANWNNSRWIVPLGASGHPGSRHYSDQSKLWSMVDTIPQLWDWDEIKLVAESNQSLTSE